MSSERAQLFIGTAIEEGWTAFRRAPWTFVGFVLLTGVLSQLLAVLPLPGVGSLLSALVNLWGAVGLVRGSWIALNGEAPRFQDFIQVNWPAIWRLFSSQIVLTLLLVPIVFGLIFASLTAADAWGLFTPIANLALTVDPTDPRITEAFSDVGPRLLQQVTTNPFAVAIVVFTAFGGLYMQVNQSFLGFIALLDGRGPLATIRHGLMVVQGQWWQVFGLLTLQALILLLGVLACFVGLVAAAPVCLCITGAAYRQLFSADDQTGLLNDR
jgi:hypothetical protein